MFKHSALGGLVAAALLATGTVAYASNAEAAAAAPNASIDVVTINGTGCSKDSTWVEKYGNSFGVDYSEFYALTGSDAAATDVRKNCQLSIHVDRPDGWTYALAEATYYGYVYLPSGTSALVRTNNYVQGSAATAYATQTLNGAYSGDYDFTTKIPAAEQQFVPCDQDRNVNINSELRLTGNTSASAFASLEWSGDYKLAWKRC